jgi:hypothetical protein
LIPRKKPTAKYDDGLLSEKSRDDKTAIELFLSGVRASQRFRGRVVIVDVDGRIDDHNVCVVRHGLAPTHESPLREMEFARFCLTVACTRRCVGLRALAARPNIVFDLTDRSAHHRPQYPSPATGTGALCRLDLA